MDKVVVIGGAGFIGRAVVSLFCESGYAVTVVSRSAGKNASSPGLKYVSGHVADANSMLEVIEGATYVCDLSMGGGTTWEEFERDYIGGARNIGKACLRHGVKRLLYTSSIAALFLGSGKPVTEADGSDPFPLQRGFYGRAKIGAEQALLELHASDKLPVAIFRPGVVVGSGGMLVHGALGDASSGTAIVGYGPGTYPLPWVLVEDVAMAMFLARNVPGIDGTAFNLAGDFCPTSQEYIAELRCRSRRNFRFIPRPLWQMGLGEYSRWAIKALMRKPGNTMVGMRDTKQLSFSSFLDNTRTKQVLGWKPCADREEFYRQTIDTHLEPIHPGDLRLSA